MISHYGNVIIQIKFCRYVTVTTDNFVGRRQFSGLSDDGHNNTFNTVKDGNRGGMFV